MGFLWKGREFFEDDIEIFWREGEFFNKPRVWRDEWKKKDNVDWNHGIIWEQRCKWYWKVFLFLFPICDVNNHIGIFLKRGLAILNLKELVSKDWKWKKKRKKESSNVDWNYGIIWMEI